MGPGLDFDAPAFVRLRSLGLLGCAPVHDDTVLSLGHTTSLANVNLKWCDQLADEAVLGCLSLLPRLASLNLKGCTLLTDDAMRALAQGVTHESLRWLNITLSAKLTRPGLVQLRMLLGGGLLMSVCADSPSMRAGGRSRA